jgi:hypothetical protein
MQLRRVERQIANFIANFIEPIQAEGQIARKMTKLLQNRTWEALRDAEWERNLIKLAVNEGARRLAEILKQLDGEPFEKVHQVFKRKW